MRRIEENTKNKHKNFNRQMLLHHCFRKTSLKIKKNESVQQNKVNTNKIIINKKKNYENKNLTNMFDNS